MSRANEALWAVLALHEPVRRYVMYLGARESFGSAEEALAACRGHSLEGYETPVYGNASEIPSYAVCGHCVKVDETGWDEMVAVPYPCETTMVIRKALVA